MQIITATLDQLEPLARLFDEYRVFYEKPADVDGCRPFIRRNLTEGRSDIFLLLDDDGIARGFCQLYPAICSLTLKDYFYLSDLYVQPSQRGKGYGRVLMDHVRQHYAASGSQRLTLDTAHSNHTAQSLYRSLGYQPEDQYQTFHLILDPQSAA